MAKRTNGEGTVRENKDRRRWEGRVTTGHDAAGKPVRRMVTGRTKAEVLKRMREASDAADAGLTPARIDYTVGRFLDMWLTDVLPGTVSPATEGQYVGVVQRYVKPRIGRKRLASLTATDVARMLRDMATPTATRPGGYSPTSQRLARAVLRRALRYAEQEGLVSRNVAGIANGVKLRRQEGRTMTVEQARSFLTAINGDRLEAAFVVALSCGLRLGELLGLGWDTVDLNGTPPKLNVRRGLKYVPKLGLILDDVKTAKSRRTIHLPTPAVAALRSHRTAQATERLAYGPGWPGKPLGADLVFRTVTGTAIDPSNFRGALSRATTAAHLGHWHPHELRHSAASILIAQGVPLKVVSETLGHSTIGITADVYAHLFDNARAEASDAMDRALAGGAG